MACDKKYKIFSSNGPLDFDCKSLREHYAKVSSDKMINPKYVTQIRETLMKCTECNQPRVDMLKELKPENSERLLAPYENLN
jgi:hypothetical protein